MNVLLKILLLPISFFYGIATWLRNQAFNLGLRTSKSYDFPVICVGNLSVGGTGKTPHTEFIIKTLSSDYRLATLSRGYGRSTKGFRIASPEDNATTLGDEPFQMYQKFKQITVAVDENRRRGISRLKKIEYAPQVIVLDDAYQHRKVKAGLNVLLTDYSKLYINDYLLPSGRLREGKKGADRADIIIVTKSPKVLSPLEIRRITSSLKPKSYQKVFFSYLAYQKLQPLNELAKAESLTKKDLSKWSVLMLTAIANNEPLLHELKRHAKEVQKVSFPDHHYFKAKDYLKVSKALDSFISPKKLIITTEKDAVRLDFSKLNQVPIFSLPIEVKFHQHHGDSFPEELIKHVRSYTRKL